MLKCFKFERKNGEWAIIVAENDVSARNLFCEDYNISETEFNREGILCRKVKFSEKIISPFFNKEVPISTVIGHIKFPPRVICDHEDYLE